MNCDRVEQPVMLWTDGKVASLPTRAIVVVVFLQFRQSGLFLKYLFLQSLFLLLIICIRSHNIRVCGDPVFESDHPPFVLSCTVVAWIAPQRLSLQFVVVVHFSVEDGDSVLPEYSFEYDIYPYYVVILFCCVLDCMRCNMIFSFFFLSLFVCFDFVFVLL